MPVEGASIKWGSLVKRAFTAVIPAVMRRKIKNSKIQYADLFGDEINLWKTMSCFCTVHRSYVLDFVQV